MTTAENLAGRWGLEFGQAVQEIGGGEDADQDLRASIESATGSELFTEDYGDPADVVVLWWRDGDGDLADSLTDACGQLNDDGSIILLTPEADRSGPIEPSDIQGAAQTVGLNQGKSRSTAAGWTGSILRPSKASR